MHPPLFVERKRSQQFPRGFIHRQCFDTCWCRALYLVVRGCLCDFVSNWHGDDLSTQGWAAFWNANFLRLIQLYTQLTVIKTKLAGNERSRDKATIAGDVLEVRRCLVGRSRHNKRWNRKNATIKSVSRRVCIFMEENIKEAHHTQVLKAIIAIHYWKAIINSRNV